MNIYLEGDTHTARMARPVAAPTAVCPTPPAVETPPAADSPILAVEEPPAADPPRPVATAAAATVFAVTASVTNRCHARPIPPTVHT